MEARASQVLHLRPTTQSQGQVPGLLGNVPPIFTPALSPSPHPQASPFTLPLAAAAASSLRFPGLGEGKPFSCPPSFSLLSPVLAGEPIGAPVDLGWRWETTIKPPTSGSSWRCVCVCVCVHSCATPPREGTGQTGGDSRGVVGHRHLAGKRHTYSHLVHYLHPLLL